jgi:hypothetical protein
VVVELDSACEEGIIFLNFVKKTMLVRSENLELQNHGRTCRKTENITI